MPQNSISAQLSNLHQLVADLEAIENGGKKAISNTIKDVKARAPGWIAQEVTAVYNIKISTHAPLRGATTSSASAAPTSFLLTRLCEARHHAAVFRV